MVRIATITPEYAKAYNHLVKRGLREHPSSFDADIAQLEKRRDRAVARGLQRFDRLNGCLLGAFDEADKLVGTAMAIRRSAPKQSHQAEVLFVYVPIEHQGKGIAKKLMTYLILSARHLNGIEQLYLTVNLNGSAARALYVSFGFQSAGVVPRAVRVDGDYFDQEHMWLALS
ncbi:GNAT family N-acetyltransferase [filamentous cyanobacterium LEGE 11480]|uniref:GNAT family N-acetyltransferase n=1 Tax=Romeriopsis navalis LEGE 11480 TaxID=2777977 RepID=A0A928Z192_9CYAN|nr:GNAT family N-acetyltransferase [Romeriopsis navalis]MBE9029086.1 GNAT family N-acetyltransferase [Romeriopsis navalis LEGE 11480]